MPVQNKPNTACTALNLHCLFNTSVRKGVEGANQRGEGGLGRTLQPLQPRPETLAAEETCSALRQLGRPSIWAC